MNYGQVYQTSGYNNYLQTSAHSSTPLTLLTSSTSSTFNTSGTYNWVSGVPSNIQMIWKMIFIRTYCKKSDHYNCNLKDNNNLTKI